MFKLFKTREEIEYESFCKGLDSMSKSIKSMVDLCKEEQKKYPKIITDSFILKAIESLLVDK